MSPDVLSLGDAADLAAVDRYDARVARLGEEAVRRESITGEEMLRVLDGVSVITIYREHEGLSRKQLAADAGMSPSYLNEIENGKKPGSVAALRKLATALRVSMDALTP